MYIITKFISLVSVDVTSMPKIHDQITCLRMRDLIIKLTRHALLFT